MGWNEGWERLVGLGVSESWGWDLNWSWEELGLAFRLGFGRFGVGAGIRDWDNWD